MKNCIKILVAGALSLLLGACAKKPDLNGGSGAASSGSAVPGGGTTPVYTVDPLVKVFFEQMFQGVLKRPSDAAGMSFWSNKVASGEVRCSEIAISFVRSEKSAAARSDAMLYNDIDRAVNYIRDYLYIGVLGRSADTAGLDFWRNQMISGLSLPAVEEYFSHSDEYIERCRVAGMPY